MTNIYIASIQELEIEKRRALDLLMEINRLIKLREKQASKKQTAAQILEE